MKIILTAIRHALASMATAFRWVATQVFAAGRWVTTFIREEIAPVLTLAGSALQTTMRPLVATANSVIDGVLSIPGRLLRHRGSGGGPQAAAAAQQAEQQARSAHSEADKALTVQQTARILIRAAAWRARGRDIGDLVAELPDGLGGYVRRLTQSECLRLSETDAKAVMDWILGKRPSLPGIRTPAEVALEGGGPRTLTPQPTFAAEARTPEEAVVLGRLRERLLDRRGEAAHARDYPNAGLPG